MGAERSIRAELADLGLGVGDRELADCDVATRLAAYGLIEAGVATPLPEDLLDTIETFADLAHFGNVRRSQEGRPEVWRE